MATITDAGYGWKLKYPTTDAQAEFFLLKFGKEVSRDDVQTLKVQFAKFDSRNQGELEEDEALRLLESRNETKTFREMRQAVADIDIDKNRKLCFLEWACAIFVKSWATLHAPSVDPEEVKRAQEISERAEKQLAEAKAAADKIREHEEEAKLAELRAKGTQAEVEAEIKRQTEARAKRLADEAAAKKEREEQLAALRKYELSQAGVRGKAAVFKYAIQDTSDPTKSNEARIRAEAAERKAKKEEEARHAKEQAAAAIAAAKAEEAARAAALKKAEALKAAAEAEEKARKAEEERIKALSGEEKMRKEREEYERQKAAAEELERKKKEAEEAKRAESRARLAAKATLWNANSSGAVLNDITKGGPALNKTTTRESSGLAQAKIFAQVQKGVPLNNVPAPASGLSDAQKAAFLEDHSQGGGQQ